MVSTIFGDGVGCYYWKSPQVFHLIGATRKKTIHLSETVCETENLLIHNQQCHFHARLSTSRQFSWLSVVIPARFQWVILKIQLMRCVSARKIHVLVFIGMFISDELSLNLFRVKGMKLTRDSPSSWRISNAVFISHKCLRSDCATHRECWSNLNPLASSIIR